MGLNLVLVIKKGSVEFAVLGVLLDGRDGAASGALAADEVLEGNGKEVALVGVDGAALGLEDLVEEIDHVFKALSLLGNSCEENVFFNLRHLKSGNGNSRI